MEPRIVMSEIFGYAWRQTKSQLWILSGLLIGYSILSFTLGIFASPMQESQSGIIVINILSLLLSSLFSLGYTRNIFQALDGEEPQFSAYVQQSKNVVNYIIAALLMTLIVFIGLVLFILPGIYLIIRLQFFLPFITEENCGAVESLKRSWEITKGAEIPLFVLLACMIGFLSLGLILLVVGVFVTIPLVSLAYAYVFRKLNRPFPI